MITACVLVKSSNFFLPLFYSFISFFHPSPPKRDFALSAFDVSRMYNKCQPSVSLACLAIARLNASIERSNKWQAPACSFIFNRTVHLIPTRRGEMYAPRYRATPFLRWPTSLPLLNLFSRFPRLIAPDCATYVARSSRNSFYPLVLVSPKMEKTERTVSVILINQKK